MRNHGRSPSVDRAFRFHFSTATDIARPMSFRNFVKHPGIMVAACVENCSEECILRSTNAARCTNSVDKEKKFETQ